MEVLDMRNLRRSARDLCVNRRAAMRRERNGGAVSERCRLEPARNPKATRRVGLENVHGARVQHRPEIPWVVAVLSRGNVLRDLLSYIRQLRQLIRGDG